MDLALLDLLRCPRTGQRLQIDARIDADRSSLRHGILRAASFRYPVLEGIAVLTTDCEPLVALARSERTAEATAMAAFGHLERSRLLPFAQAAAHLRGLGGLATTFERRVRARTVDRDVRLLFGPDGSGALACDPLEILFLGNRRPSSEGYHYFRYRFGTPRYLVSLALWDAQPPSSGSVLDVGCGAGHLAWAIGQRPQAGPVVGIDTAFAQLLAARTIAPEATLVCGDGRSLPVADAAFARVVSSDVLPYVAEKISVARELSRVLHPDGTITLTALRNAGREHVHGGEPLAAPEWASLFAALPERRLLADDAVLDRYLVGEAPGGLRSENLESSQTLSIIAGHRPTELRRGNWEQWPHSIGPLAVNPLLEPVGEQPTGTRFVRRFPSDTYRIDNPRIVDYLPETCVIPHGVLSPPGPVAALRTPGEQLAAASPDQREQLLARIALLAMPNPKTMPRPRR
ncbi:MAG: methyltransferase domain-containing protein [Acidimicrobiia bacterium]